VRPPPCESLYYGEAIVEATRAAVNCSAAKGMISHTEPRKNGMNTPIALPKARKPVCWIAGFLPFWYRFSGFR